MNNTFSFKRFGWLLREILVERWVYFVGLFVIIAVGQLLFGYAADPTSMPLTQKMRFVVGGAVGMAAVAAILIKRYQHTATGISNILLPVSNLEKWGSIILFNFVLFWIIYLSVFFLTDKIIYEIWLSRAKQDNYQNGIKFLQEFDAVENIRSTIYPTIIFLSFFTGWIIIMATYVRKNALVAGIISFGIFWLVLILINWGVAQMFFEQSLNFGQANPFVSVIVNTSMPSEDGMSFKLVSHYPDTLLVLFHFVLPMLAATMLLIYYFRLKETEI